MFKKELIAPYNASIFVPTVIEKDPKGYEHTSDLFSRLLRDRIIFLVGVVEEILANVIVAQLLFLESDDPEKEIYLYINSPGGSITAGMAIYDTMQFIKPLVSTCCIGQACSMGAFLLGSGAKGKRFCLPNARMMLHQPLGGFQGQASDIAIHAKEILYVRERMERLLAYHTNQPMEKIHLDTERDRFMNGDEAVEYGLIDEILYTRDKAKEISKSNKNQGASGKK